MPEPSIAYALSGRVQEKQEVRDADDAAIASGLVTKAEVARRNGLFASSNLMSFRLSRLGGKPMKKHR